MSALSEQQERIRQTMAAMWQRNLPLVHERVDALDHAAELAAQSQLTPEARKDAAGVAHKIAGSVGMFGFTEATELARTLEVMLEAEAPVDALALRELCVSLRASLKL